MKYLIFTVTIVLGACLATTKTPLPATPPKAPPQSALSYTDPSKFPGATVIKLTSDKMRAAAYELLAADLQLNEERRLRAEETERVLRPLVERQATLRAFFNIPGDTVYFVRPTENAVVFVPLRPAQGPSRQPPAPTDGGIVNVDGGQHGQ